MSRLDGSLAVGVASLCCASGCMSRVGLGYDDVELGRLPPAHGQLDPTFADTGIFSLDVDGIDNLAWGGQGIDVQPDGRMVVAGVAGTAANKDFLVLRLRQDGTLDPSFGAGGIARVDLGTPDDGANSVLVQPDGTIMVAGFAAGNSGVARLLADGTLDATFGNAGVLVLDLLGAQEVINSQVRLADGRLRLCGQGSVSATSPTRSDVVVYGLQSDGSLETGFGTGGVVTIDFFNNEDFGGCRSLDSEGRLLVDANAWHDPVGFDFGLARLLPDGSLDPTFSDATGLTGRVVTDFFGATDFSSACVVVADGKIVCGGSTMDGTESLFGLARYLPDGELDATFGTGGKAVASMGVGATLRALVTLADGRLIAGGYVTSSRGDTDMALAALTADGALDASFGTGGREYFDLNAGSNDAILAMTLDSRGLVLVYGETSDSTSTNLVVMRLGP